MTKNNRDERREQLVEEIAETWEPWGGPGGYYPDWVKVQRAKATVARIAQAYKERVLAAAQIFADPENQPAQYDISELPRLLARIFEEEK